MQQQYEYHEHKYWVTVEPVIQTSGEPGFIAFVSNAEPSGFFYGSTVKDSEGRTIIFETSLSAFTNANAVKQSELGKR